MVLLTKKPKEILKMKNKKLHRKKRTVKTFHSQKGLKNLSPNDTNNSDTDIVIYNQSISQSSINGNKKNKIDRQIDISN